MLALRKLARRRRVVAGMLGRPARCPARRVRLERRNWLPFSRRAPHAFSDGPFRLAAMLRRPVVFITGIYHGGDRYETALRCR